MQFRNHRLQFVQAEQLMPIFHGRCEWIYTENVKFSTECQIYNSGRRMDNFWKTLELSTHIRFGSQNIQK